MILVIDDDYDILSLIKSSLEGEFDVIVFSENIEAAKSEVIDHKYDLIILDIMLENKNGAEIINFIKSNKNLNKETPIVIISSFITEEFTAKNKNNFFMMIKKPFSSNDILDAAKSAIKEMNKGGQL